MENSIPLDHDLYMSYDDIKAISEITWKHPISWDYIRRAVEDAIPLIDYMGPDAISYAVNKEKNIRNLPLLQPYYTSIKMSSYDPKCGFNEWYELQPQYDNNTTTINMEHINESNRRNE